jgi:pimeloyl-ACP methyl ester carboxylesterase
MTIIVNVLAVIACSIIWNCLWRWLYPVRTGPDEIHFVTTEDNCRIAVSRFCPKNPNGRHPIILCHGTGVNALLFDIVPESSLARFLANAGWDVWALDLRGHGHSQKPNPLWRLRGDDGYTWDVDSHLKLDIPAAISLVLETTGAPQVHWLGLSKGANLIFAFLAVGDQKKIKSAIPVAGSLDFSGSGSDYEKLLRYRTLLNLVPRVPTKWFANLMVPFTGMFTNRLEKFLYWPGNITPLVAKTFHAHGFEDIAPGVLRQQATLFDPGGMRSRDDVTHYFDHLGKVETPILCITGDRDYQCPTSATKKSFDAVSSSTKEFVTFGKEQGHKEHYGHMDLIAGRHASVDVYPTILNWLDRTDPETTKK